MASQSPLRILTRGSALALAQATAIQAQCRALFPDLRFEVVIIKTTGDKLQTASLSATDLPKGLFTKELETALLNGEGDLAVHSLKDLPGELPEGLVLGAVTAREDVRDLMVYRGPGFPAGGPGRVFPAGLALDGLPAGATVATSSTRRAAQTLERRPDLKVVPIRGNVGTRLRKLAAQPDWDATLLAAAGLRRLHLLDAAGTGLAGEDVPAGLAASAISVEAMIPAVGQAAIGIETRRDDPRVKRVCEGLHHTETGLCVTAERVYLQAMGGGCHLAVAAYAQVQDGQLHMCAVSYLDGRPRRAQASGPLSDPAGLGEKLARSVGR